MTSLLQLLRPEVDRHTNWWAWLGAVCGAGIGFIIGNLPGLMLGGVAGNRLGAVRDAKGKSVAAVFNDLGNQQKAEVIVLSHQVNPACQTNNERFIRSCAHWQ